MLYSRLQQTCHLKLGGGGGGEDLYGFASLGVKVVTKMSKIQLVASCFTQGYSGV